MTLARQVYRVKYLPIKMEYFQFINANKKHEFIKINN